MKFTPKLILKIGAVLSGLAFADQLKKYKDLADNIEIKVSPDFDLGRRVAIVRATAKNPISQKIKIKQPTVRVLHSGNIVASSEPSKQTVEIPANGSVDLEPIELSLNGGGLVASLVNLFKVEGNVLETVLFTSLVTMVGNFDIPPIKNTVEVKQAKKPERKEGANGLLGYAFEGMTIV